MEETDHCVVHVFVGTKRKGEQMGSKCISVLKELTVGCENLVFSLKHTHDKRFDIKQLCPFVVQGCLFVEAVNFARINFLYLRIYTYRIVHIQTS